MAEVLTIGAYGWDAETFFAALVRERVAVFCDLRRRRGVRGPEYAFANSERLQERLGDLGLLGDQAGGGATARSSRRRSRRPIPRNA